MIRCPYCNADRHHLTLDCRVVISCHIDDRGYPVINDYWYNTDELEMQVSSCSNEDLKFFCTECGAEFPACFNDEGQVIVGIEEIKVKDVS